MDKPHFIINKYFQKRSDTYQELLTSDVLADVSIRITGKSSYTVEYREETNVGRMAVLEYKGQTNIISFSEDRVNSRNSSFQSFPSALLYFYEHHNPHKRMFFYFLPTIGGSIETPYFIFMYRLMLTCGCQLLNCKESISTDVRPFVSVDDLIVHRDRNRGKNKSNTSSYVTTSQDDVLQIYGKVYGASKYETTLLCIAIQQLDTRAVELYQIVEGNLKEIPARAREVVASLGVKIIRSDIQWERAVYQRGESYRSPAFLYNLLSRLGEKKCVLCDCEIPQIIQGAHVWNVSSIKTNNALTDSDKLHHATNGHNGLWLCNNHHALFDSNIIMLDENGTVKVRRDIRQSDGEFIFAATSNRFVPEEIVNDNFRWYLSKRNSVINQTSYIQAI